MKHQPNILQEGLKTKDLKGFLSDVFTVDRLKSKMGEDADVVVLGFRVKEKYPAIDLMEFIEKGYEFILDADMSTGEEFDGQYQVFVEMERTTKLPNQIKELLNGISLLSDCWDWKFKYQKDKTAIPVSDSALTEHIPMSDLAYKQYMLEVKNQDLQEFFDKGIAEIAVESDNTITFSRPYSGDVTAKFVAIGDYETIKDTLPGALSLDEGSQSEMFFLAKYFGNYDINKIGDKFLIRDGNRAVVIEKGRW